MHPQERSHESPPASGDAAAPFLRLSKRVERRLTLARWLDALRRTALPLFGVLVLGLGAAWLGGIRELPLIARAVFPAAIAVFVLWIVGFALYARHRSPGHTAALALFDQRGHWKEMFVSAYSFARDPARGPGPNLHIRRAHAALSEAAARLEESMPVRAAPVTVWAPLVFLAAAFLGLPALASLPPAEDATAEAALVGQSLNEEARALDRMEEGLSDEEKEKLEKLKKDLEKSAQKMADLEKEKSPRDILEELESRARDAEKLAEMLGADSEKIGSAMLAELERHADTAELAGSLRGQKLDRASKEAAKLARRLRAEDLSLEARKRIENAFISGLKVATPRDLKTLLGRHMTTAQGELERDQPKRAADEFDALARSYQRMLERMNSMQALKRLAQNLRTSGQRALGQNQGGMERIQGLSASTLAKVGSRPVKLSLGSRAPSAGNRSSSSGKPSSNARPGSPVPGTQAPTGKPCPG